MISFVENKVVNWNAVETYLAESKNLNHWTNFGPVAAKLEQRVSKLLNLDTSLSVVACASGTAALHSLVLLQNILAGRELKWVASSFNFPCAYQGPLSKVKLVDCDSRALLSLDSITKSGCDAALFTNVFGQLENCDRIRDFCSAHDISLVIDSAKALGSVRHLENEAISFHHTKPWGFGEGGVAIVSKENEEALRSVLNFGRRTNFSFKREAFNGKMSDISAAFILQWLDRFDESRQEYINQFNRIRSIASELDIDCLISEIYSIPSDVPLMFSKPVRLLEKTKVALKKYYAPLEDLRNSTIIHERIVNFPCVPEIGELSDRDIENILHDLNESG